MKLLTEHQRARLAGKRIVASVSGGKDSTALSLFLTANGIDHDRVFADTGWEADITYDYIRTVLEPALGPITWVSAPKQMEALCLEKAMFPSRNRKWCTEKLKVKPIRAFLEQRREQLGVEVVSAVGVRAGESKFRATLDEWEESKELDADVWRPLLHATEQEVMDLLLSHGVMPNPLYLKGAQRVGCWPCIFSRKSEIALIAKIDPARIDRLRALELALNEEADKRWAHKRTEGEAQERMAWFRAKKVSKGAVHEEYWDIDKIVAWATQYNQTMLLEEDHPGCHKWGLCESAT